MPRVTYTYNFSYGRPGQAGQGALPPRPPGLLARILGVVISIAVLGVLTVIGILVLPVLLAVVLLGAIYIGVKVWLFKRQVEQAFQQPPPQPEPHRPSGDGEYIDADYIERD